MSRITALALALLALTACTGDASDDTGFGGGPTGPIAPPTDSDGGLQNDPHDNGNGCVINADCGRHRGVCVYENGCDEPGRCTLGDIPDECPQNPPPILDEPEAPPCEVDDDCVDVFNRLRCIMWDGKCGDELGGYCLTENETADLLAGLGDGPYEFCPGTPLDGSGWHSPAY